MHLLYICVGIIDCKSRRNKCLYLNEYTYIEEWNVMNGMGMVRYEWNDRNDVRFKITALITA